MNKNYLNIVLVLLLALTACKKEVGSFNSGELVGKWHQTKLNLHETSGNVVLHDTTFLGDSFTDPDFYQFNSNKTATLSRSGNFWFGGKSTILNADVLFDFVTNYTYSVADSTITLKVKDIPADITINSNGQPYNQSPIIVQLDNNHLVLRTQYSYNYMATVPQALVGLTTTAYFTRE